MKRRALTGSLIGALTCAAPAHADIIAQTAQGFVSRNVVAVAASPAAVWKRLVTPSAWWSSDHTFSGDAANLSLDPMPGGCFCERLPGEALPAAKGAKPAHAPALGGVEHMHVVYAERGKALRMTGALGPLQSEAVQGTLTITLKAVDGGTRIVFEYAVGGYMRYPADKIVPAIDAVLSNQLLGLAHGFAPVAGAQAAEQRPAVQEGDSPQPADRGLDKNGILLPRGHIWSLPPSDTAAAAPVAPVQIPVPAPPVPPLPTATLPQDVVPSGGGQGQAKHAESAQQPVAPDPVAAQPDPAQPVPDTSTPPPVAAKKPGKQPGKAPVKPVTPPQSDEPSTDAVNSEFDNALGDPQRPVPTTP